MNAVKNIAIAASLAKLFRGGAICPQFNARDLWTHSIAVAACTRLLSKRIRLGLPDEAFLGGLIHDLGLMVEMQARRPQLVEAFQQMDRRPGLTLRQAEIEAMGASHEDFGAGLCKLWKFPTSFVYVTGHHHHPRDVHPRNRSLVGLVHVSDVLAARLKLGFTRSVETATLDTELLQELNLTPEILAEVEKELPAAIQEATSLLQDGSA
jgi:HD-like signal output (HDOD) protein